jgi:hypothetical protein
MRLAVAVAPAVLNSSHRCDACGSSRAYVVAILRASERIPNGGELMFCRHDWLAQADALMPYLAALIDETSQLGVHIADDHHL